MVGRTLCLARSMRVCVCVLRMVLTLLVRSMYRPDASHTGPTSAPVLHTITRHWHLYSCLLLIAHCLFTLYGRVLCFLLHTLYSHSTITEGGGERTSVYESNAAAESSFMQQPPVSSLQIGQGFGFAGHAFPGTRQPTPVLACTRLSAPLLFSLTDRKSVV